MDIRCRITSGGGDPRESATENRPPRRPLPTLPRLRGRVGGGAAVRVKRCGKSAPRLRQRKRHGKPHREQNRIGTAWNPPSRKRRRRSRIDVGILPSGGGAPPDG